MLIFDKFANNKHHRSKLDVIAQILTAALEPKGKTKLMHITMISSQQVREYLTELLSNGLLSYDEVIRAFFIRNRTVTYDALYNQRIL